MEGTKDKSALENIAEEGWQRGLEDNKSYKYTPIGKTVRYQAGWAQFAFMVKWHSKLGWLAL